MLHRAKTAGAKAALRQYGVKEAGVFGTAARWLGNTAKDSLGNIGRAYVGNPEQLFQGVRAFKPGGAFHWRNVLWPTANIPAGATTRERIQGQAGQWLGRTMGTLLPAYGVYQSIKHPDPSQGTLTNALGAIGEAVGGSYGYPIGGMLGGGFISSAGRRLGEGLGKALGSHPAPLPPTPPPQEYGGVPMPHDMYQGQTP